MRIQSINNQNPFVYKQKTQNNLNQSHVKRDNPTDQSPSFKGLKGLLFDVDGTLVVNAHLHKEAWIQFCINTRPKNLPFSLSEPLTAGEREQIKKFLSDGSTKSVIRQLFGDDISEEQIEKHAQGKRGIYDLLANDLKEINGLSPFLNSVTDIKKAIGTCASLKNVNKYLKLFGIEHHFKPEHIVDESKVIKTKPDPEVYIKAANSINVNPEECAVFEDTETGIKSGLAAGSKIVGLATSLSKENLLDIGASYAIKDYTEIDRQKLSKLFGNR